MDPTAYGAINLIAAFWDEVLKDLRSRRLNTRVEAVAWLYTAEFKSWANLSGFPPKDVRAAMLRRSAESVDIRRETAYTTRRRDNMRCSA